MRNFIEIKDIIGIYYKNYLYKILQLMRKDTRWNEE